MTKTEIKNVIQNYVDGYGLGISKEKLVDKVYGHMYSLGYRVYQINERYLGVVDGDNEFEYQFIKSKKNHCWIVKDY